MSILNKIRSSWDEYGFEIVLGLCVLFILFYAVYNKSTGKRGTWTKYYNYINFYDNKNDYRVQVKNSDVDTSNYNKKPKDSKGETECRRVLEKIFRVPFNKSRPNFLNNPVTDGGHNLELDCFNERLGLAVEYDGEQHMKYIPFFHKNKEAFLNQKYRDELKNRMCKDNNIILIRVPYTVKTENIESYLRKELSKYYKII